MGRGEQSSIRTRPRRVAADPASRAPWGTISREQIVDAATRLVKAGGYRGMTIRSLASELGVAPMSLYRYVRDKDDLLGEVVDRLLAKSWKPRADERDWQAWVTEAAEKLCRFLVAQPAAMHIYLRRPVVSPAAIKRMNAMMDVLRRAGADDAAALRAYGAVHTYTIGFASLAASRADWHPADGGDVESAEVTRQLAAYTTPQQFATGLGYLLEGIGHQSELLN